MNLFVFNKKKLFETVILLSFASIMGVQGSDTEDGAKPKDSKSRQFFQNRLQKTKELAVGAKDSATDKLAQIKKDIKDPCNKEAMENLKNENTKLEEKLSQYRTVSTNLNKQLEDAKMNAENECKVKLKKLNTEVLGLTHDHMVCDVDKTFAEGESKRLQRELNTVKSSNAKLQSDLDGEKMRSKKIQESLSDCLLGDLK